jgi:hypothetical protein
VTLLPRYYRYQQIQEAQQQVDRAIQESGGAPEHTPPTTQRATLPGDRRRLRGIPVAGGACGTSPGTDPLAETLRKLG